MNSQKEINDIITQIEQIKNIKDKIELLLNPNTINSLKETEYIFISFKKETEYRKKLFLNNPNFYKAINPRQLYEYILIQNDINIYEYITNEKVFNHIKKIDNIGTIIEKMENVELIKKLILNPLIFKQLQEEYNYTPLLLFKDDEEIKNYLKNNNIPNNIKEFYEKGIIDNLYDEEIIYIIEHINNSNILNYISEEKVIKEIRKEPDILYKIYKKNIDKKILLNNEYFTNLLTKEILDQIIYNNHNIEISKIILTNENIIEILDGDSILLMLTENVEQYKPYLENKKIANKFNNDTINKIINLIDEKTIYTYLFILLTKEIVKNINLIAFFNKIKIRPSKLYLRYIYELVELNKYKRQIIDDIMDRKEPLKDLENEILNNIENMKSNEIIDILKEEIKEGSICKNINIDKILNYLYKNPNYEITKEYFEIILFRLFQNIKNEKYENIELKMNPLENQEGMASREKIELNSNMIENTLNKNIFAFSVFFHEMTHIKQYNEIEQFIYKYETLKQLKEEVLRDEIPYYYEECYYVLSLETEAYIKGKIEAIKYFKEHTNQIPNKENIVQKIKKVSKYLNITTRIINGNIYSLESLFDEKVDKEHIKDLIETYPILLLEYNEDGTKKSLEQIILLYSTYKKEYENNKTKENIQKYAFYSKLLKDKLLKNQDKVTDKLLLQLCSDINNLKENDNQTYNEELKKIKKSV